jgi:hypothetical protein
VTRTSAVLVVLALVLLAGCSSFGGVSTTRQPFDVEDTTTPSTTTTDPDKQPPAVAFDPVADTAPNGFDLVDAHYGKLAGRSYTVQYDREQRFANGTLFSGEEWTTTFGPNRSRYAQDRRSTLRNMTTHRQLFANGSAVWEWSRSNDAGEPSIGLVRSPRGDLVPPRNVAVRAVPRTLRTGFAATNVTDVRALDTVPSGVNEPVFQVVGNETATANPFGDRTLSVSMLLIVTEEGRIVEYALETTFVDDGERFHAQTRVQFRGVGRVSVDRPNWVPGNASTDAAEVTPTDTDRGRVHLRASTTGRSDHPVRTPECRPESADGRQSVWTDSAPTDTRPVNSPPTVS